MSAVVPMVAPRPALRRTVFAREPLDLEARLVAFARAPAALRRALARVAGRIAALRGWERLGFARSGDYAVERAGVSAREFRDLAAVDVALGELPLLDAAFRAGDIGWTQLRLLCRVATAEDQEEWLALGGRLTARALAREVRAVDRRAREPLSMGSESDGEEREGVVLRLDPARAGALVEGTPGWEPSRGPRALARRVRGGARGRGALGVPLDGAFEPKPGSAREAARDEIDDTGGPSPIPLPRRPPASPLPPDPEVAALEQGLDDCDPFELDRRLRRAVHTGSPRPRARRVAALRRRGVGIAS